MKKNMTVKIIAFLALFWIIISVVWTWILVFFSDNNYTETENTLSPEDLQKIIDSQEIKFWTGTSDLWIEIK